MQRFYWIFLGWMFFGTSLIFPQDGVNRDDSRNAIAAVESLDFGSVDPRSGSLSFQIPVGQAYPQRNGSQYQISLKYSSHIYDYINNPETREGNGGGDIGPPDPPLIDTRLAYLKWYPKLAFAGMGFMVDTGFGSLRIHNSVSTFAKKATLTLSGGQRIFFYDKFQEGDTGTANTWFSRGGEYARLLYKPAQDLYEVEMADGRIQVFEYIDGDLLATRIKDRFSEANSISISYGETTIEGETYPQWTITDSLNRPFTITFGKKFKPYGEAEQRDNPDIHPIFLLVPEFYVATSITVPTYNDTFSTYEFTYDDFTGFEPFHDPHTLDPIFFNEYHAPLLNTLTIPNLETFSFDYYETQEPGSHVGAIKTFTNNFGGSVTWEYTKIYDPNNSGSHRYNDPHMGVSKEKIFDRGGSTLLAKTEYLYLLLDPDGIYGDPHGVGAGRGPSLRRDRVTIMRHYETATSFNDTAYFFNMRNYRATESEEEHLKFLNPLGGQGTGESRFFQMPGTPLLYKRIKLPEHANAQYDVFLSKIAYKGSFSDDNPGISEYIAYTNDPHLLREDNKIRWDHDQLINSRDWLNMTYFHEGQKARISYQKDWDRFGKYRTQVQAKRFIQIENGLFSLQNRTLRTTYQHYLPGPETNAEAGDLIWILNRPSYSIVTESDSNQTLKTEFDYDLNNGFLRRIRNLKNLDGSRSAHDQLVVNIPDPEDRGRISEVHSYGGDIKSIPYDENTPLSNLDLSDHNPETRTKITFEYGSIKTQEALYKNTGNRYLLLKDNKIDEHTGLVTKETTPDGVSINYIYDTMGRQKEKNPTDGARTFTTYSNANHAAAAKITTKTKLGGTVYTDSRDFLNGWGNLIRRRSLHSNSKWSVQEWNYTHHPDGRLNQVSTIYEEDPESEEDKTWIINDYDELGRQKSITFPDGKITRFDYVGNQSFSVTKKIGTGDLHTEETKTTHFDALGRTIQVIQDDNDDGTAASAFYEYNTLGKLVKVSLDSIDHGQATQNRVWNYDGLGNLLSEYHPEFDAYMVYRKHDSGGRAGEIEQLYQNVTVHKLNYIFKDPMRRLTQILDAQKNRPILENFYSRENQGNSRSAGKLFQVRRHNYADIGKSLTHENNEQNKEILVTRTYFYEGNNGSVSKMRVRTSEGQFNDAMAFEQTITQTNTGTVDKLGYPQLMTGLRNDQSLTVEHLYHTSNQSLLKQLKVGTQSPVKIINYYPSGMVKNMTYANNVKKIIAINFVNNISRPHRIHTTGVIDVTTGEARNFDTGPFKYDGDNNVTDIGDDYYTYDSVGRLTEAMTTDLEGVGQSFTYTYDRFGNLTSKNGIAMSVNNAKNRLTEPGYSYDERGNVLSTGEVTYSYDPLNMTKTADDVSGFETYIYEATAEGKDYRLLTIKDDGTCQWTLRGLNNKILRTYEKGHISSIRAAKDYLFTGGLSATFEYLESGLTKKQYIVSDHLNSIRMRTDGAGRLVRQYKYDPFGNDLLGSSTQNDDRLRFTEHERDNDHQIYMLARYYNPKFSRFNSVDPVLGSIGDPQSWNRYTYVKNNPIKFIDPNGESPSRPLTRKEYNQTIAGKNNQAGLEVKLMILGALCEPCDAAMLAIDILQNGPQAYHASAALPGVPVVAAKLGKKLKNVGRYKKHTTPDDLSAARRELNGEVVARKADGTPYNHVHEVRDAQSGLIRRIEAINKSLSNPKISDERRNQLLEELATASKILDNTEKYVPRVK